MNGTTTTDCPIQCLAVSHTVEILRFKYYPLQSMIDLNRLSTFNILTQPRVACVSKRLERERERRVRPLMWCTVQSARTRKD